MTFQPLNFRAITAQSKPFFKIREHVGSTLILIKANGEARYGRTTRDKDGIIASADHTADLLLWAWTGRHYTDVFRLTAEDVTQHYR